MHKTKALSTVVLAMFVCCSCLTQGEKINVPERYRRLYGQLEAILDAFDADLLNRWDGRPHATIFAAELLPANAHRGDALLRKNAMAGIRIYLDRLRELGVRGVKVCMAWTLLATESPRSERYWAFYREVTSEVRRRGMKLLVGIGPLFTSPEFSNVPVDYSSLTFAQYKAFKRKVAQRIIVETRPDFLTVSNEPLTEANLTGLKELLNPQRYVQMVHELIKDLPRGKVKIGAGSGTWDNPTFVRLLASETNLDYIDLHIYPITSGYLQRASELAEIARRAGKEVVIGEAWLYKATPTEATQAHGAATWSEIFRRDVFSFWEPLDEKFTEVMIHFAHCHRVQFLSLFWSRHLFAYLDYSDELEKAPVTIAFQRANHATVRNLLMGRYSNMGKHYSALIRGRKGRLDVSFRNGKRVSGTKSPHLGRVCILGRGARPRFSPDGKLIVFDRKNPDGFYDVYLMNLKGHIVRSLTDGRSDFLQRHNGNATIHPSGKFVVFLSEEEHHPWLELFWLGDPGLGLFCNLWATDLEGRRFWKLTNIPIKRDISDATPVFGVVNPLFSPDGEWLLWTERFGHGGHHNWGRWRVKRARWMLKEGKPSLEGEEVLFVPRRGNYVTAMGFLDKSHLLIAGNLDGQHEYGMDQYVLDLATGRLTNLHNTPKFWEEDAAITPDGRHIIYMSNATSRYALNFDDPNWVAQPREREYWLMSADKGHRERLTYFNEPSAPEYLGRRIIVAAADISPDGKWLVGTLGIDFGDERRAKIALKVVLFELNIRQ